MRFLTKTYKRGSNANLVLTTILNLTYLFLSKTWFHTLVSDMKAEIVLYLKFHYVLYESAQIEYGLVFKKDSSHETNETCSIMLNMTFSDS